MTDFYNDPIGNAYQLSRTRWFDMPQENGRMVKVIAVSSQEATYWIVGYAIIVSMIFVAVAKLATTLALTYFPLESRGNQYVMLVSFYNANSPATAAIQTFNYIRQAIFNCTRGGERSTDWHTVKSGLWLTALSLALLGGDAAAKFLVSGNQLIVRRAARANPSVMFYPDRADRDTLQGGSPFAAVQPIVAAAAFQTVGRVAASRKRIEQYVHIHTVNGTSPEGPTWRMQYDYAVTGADMGLQTAHHLQYFVSGECQTTYEWLNTTDPVRDEYYGFGNKSNTNFVWFERDSRTPGWANIYLHPDGIRGTRMNGGTWEFGINPITAWRGSPVENSVDAWYLTEPNPLFNATTNRTQSPHRVRRGRPAVSCKQNDTWSYGGKSVRLVENLKDLPGLRLSNFMREILLQREFSAPRISLIGNNLGYARLDSALITNPNSGPGVFTAVYANSTRDMERLIQASFVYSREVVRNTVLLYSSLIGRTGLTNIAADESGQVPYESADFILDSQNVAAMSVLTLIITPCVCVFVWILVLLRGKLDYGAMSASNEGKVSQHNLRAIGLQASQLYRYLDEQIAGIQRWSGRTSMTPFIKELDLEKPARGDNEEILPRDAMSPYIQPKIVRSDNSPGLLMPGSDSESKQPAEERTDSLQPRTPFWQKLMFWKKAETGKAPRYEIAMTRKWEPKLGHEQGTHLTFEDVLKDL